MKGSDGQSGFTESLPKEKTETGTWANNEVTFTPITFPIPLGGDIAGGDVVMVAAETAAPAACDDGTGAAASAANPEADPGKLCIFVTLGTAPDAIFKVGSIAEFGAGKAGAVLAYFSKKTTYGSFAVTAP